MPRHTQGFTLPELLTTLGILAVLTSAGAPGILQLVGNRQLSTASENLAMDLMLARSESIKRRQPVLVDNGVGNWQNGWQVYVDLNNNGLLDEGEPILRQGEPLPRDVVAKGNTPVRRYVRYTPPGNAKLLSGALQAGTVTLCHATGNQVIRYTVISASGRLRRARGAPGHC